MIHDLIETLVELSNTSKLFNWTTHGLAVAIFAGLGWVFSGPIVSHLASHGEGVRAGLLAATDVGAFIYLFREAETVFMRWIRTGKLTILEDNLGDLIGPTIVVVAVHLFA